MFKRKPKPKPVVKTGRVIDMTRTTWGHNFSVDPQLNGSWTGWVWSTPGPKVGDQLTWKTDYGVAVLDVVESTWTVNVDDMYKVRLVLAERIVK